MFFAFAYNQDKSCFRICQGKSQIAVQNIEPPVFPAFYFSKKSENIEERIMPMHNSEHKAAALLLSAVLASGLLSGCSSTPANEPEKTAAGQENESEKTIQITDDLDRTIEIRKPERTAILIGSFADMWNDAGGADTLAAAAHDSWTSFDLPLENVTDLGEVKNISLEALLDSRPDLVIASSKNESQKELKSRLDASGIPVLYFDVSSFEDYLRVFSIFCTLTGNEQAWQQKALAQQQEIDAVKAAVPAENHPSVLALRATSKGVKALGNSGSVLGEMLADLQADNIARDGFSTDTLSMEEIIERDPDCIFLVYQGSREDAERQAEQVLFSNPAYQSLSAVKNGRVYVLDPSLYNLKPNDRWAEAYAGLFEDLYPDAEAPEESGSHA